MDRIRQVSQQCDGFHSWPNDLVFDALISCLRDRFEVVDAHERVISLIRHT